MSKRFLQGGALVPTPDHALVGANTLTGIVFSQARLKMTPCFIMGRINNKAKRLWYRGAAADVRRGAYHMGLSNI